MSAGGQPLYRRLIGEADYGRLPALIRRMHEVDGVVTARGRASVSRPGGWLARRCAGLLGMPPAGDDLPALVTFSRTGEAEILRRQYGDATLTTVQQEGAGADAGHLLEKFGPVSLVIKLCASEAALGFDIVRARMFGLPLPRSFWPRLAAREFVEGDWYRFQVAIGLPLIGPLVRYEGRLQVVDDS